MHSMVAMASSSAVEGTAPRMRDFASELRCTEAGACLHAARHSPAAAPVRPSAASEFPRRPRCLLDDDLYCRSI